VHARRVGTLSGCSLRGSLLTVRLSPGCGATPLSGSRAGRVQRTEGVVLTALVALFICRAVLANAIVPPWQGPDEPGHFALAYNMRLATNMEDQVRMEVLQSMVRHRWWALYDDPPPEPLAAAVSTLGWGTLNQPLYYSLAGSVLKLSRPPSLEAAYYHLRILGVVLAGAALSVGWAGTRLLFGPEIAAGAAAIGALHPQFLLASISVNADVLVNLCGAVVWWQGARAIRGRRRDLSLIMMFIAAATALFTKRIGMVLLVIAIPVAVAALVAGRTGRVTWRDALRIAVIPVVGVAAAMSVRFLFPDETDKLWQYWWNVYGPESTLEEAVRAEGLRFGRMTADYFWLIGGWLRFQPPTPWLWAARILTAAGLIGAVIELVRPLNGRAPLAMAGWFVITQVAAMLAAVLWLDPSAPQARYLFPVFVPITVLLYVGLRRLVPRRYGPQVPVALVVVLMTLDVTGFSTVHMPAYLP
jgi:hypothetical protein